jgi:integrase
LTITEKTEAAAKRRIRDLQAQIAREGLPAAGSSRSATVKTWAEEWLAIREGDRDLRPASLRDYRTQVRRHIIPTIGRKRIDALTPMDVRAVIAAMQKIGRAPATVAKTHRVLIELLRDAMTMGGLEVPRSVLLVRGPMKGEPDRAAMTLQDALAVLNIVAGRPDRSRWVAALLQGMRQGEALGLLWDHVLFDAGPVGPEGQPCGLIEIKWQLGRIAYAHGCGDQPCGYRVEGRCPDRRPLIKAGDRVKPLKGGLALVNPKSKSGDRVIPMVPWMRAALLEWREVCPPSRHGLVWPDDLGQPQRAGADLAAWYEIQEAAQVVNQSADKPRPYFLHEARHTTATLLLEAGVSPEVVTAIMGHSSMASTRPYLTIHSELALTALAGVAGRLQLGAPTI